MLRGCEHRDGLRVSDVVDCDVYNGNGRVLLLIGAREQARKIKTRPPRTVTLPVWNSRISAGAALLIFMERVHAHAAPSDVLFPFIEYSGRVYGDVAVNDKVFIKTVRPLLLAAGMHDDDVKRFTSHSLRAGGATDNSVANMSQDFIRAQGGWTSDCFMIYVRPQTFHSHFTAQRIAARFDNFDKVAQADAVDFGQQGAGSRRSWPNHQHGGGHFKAN